MPKNSPHQSPQSFLTTNPKNKSFNLVGNKNRGEGVSEVNNENDRDTQFCNKNINDLLKIGFPRNYEMAEGKNWDLCEKTSVKNTCN